MLKKPPRLKSPRKLATHFKRAPIKGSALAKGSSHVESTQYDPDLGHLTVTFAGGRRYRYSGVSKETAAGIDTAESLGQYLHAHVIGKHDAIKI